MGKPNIIVFFTDQQRHDVAGLHGNPLNLTPNFDRLASAGTHLTQSITCQPVCGPARSCIQTGMYQTLTGAWKNGLAPEPGTRMLGHYFSDAGYDTGYIGKWHLAPDTEIAKYGPGPVMPEYRGGYQYWLASNILEFTSDAYQTRVFNNDNQPVDLPGYRVDALTDAAIRYVTDPERENPFFLFLSFLEPHHQNGRDDYPAPVGYEARYRDQWMPPDLAALGGCAAKDLPGYLGMVKRIDEALGRLVDALISTDQLKDTVILFTSDHGNHFRTRNKEFKRSCHEASVHVPTMFYGGEFNNRLPLRQVVSLIDLTPTLLDVAGIPIPPEMPGRSLLPLVRDPSTPWANEVLIHISEHQVGRAIRTDRWKYSVRSPELDGFHHESADVYVEDCLYDLHADPYELHNLVKRESHRAIAESLRERLLARIVEAGERRPTILPAQPARVPERQTSQLSMG